MIRYRIAQARFENTLENLPEAHDSN